MGGFEGVRVLNAIVRGDQSEGIPGQCKIRGRNGQGERAGTPAMSPDPASSGAGTPVVMSVERFAIAIVKDEKAAKDELKEIKFFASPYPQGPVGRWCNKERGGAAAGRLG